MVRGRLVRLGGLQVEAISTISSRTDRAKAVFLDVSYGKIGVVNATFAPLFDRHSGLLELRKKGKRMQRTHAIQVKSMVRTPPFAATMQNVSRQLALHPQRKRAKILFAELSKRE